MAEVWLGDSDGPMGDVGAFMASELRVDRADLAGHIRQLEAPRNLIAITGAPASGKSHLAVELAAALNATAAGSAAVLAMDGFHRPNDWLAAQGLTGRKGAPESFDVDALADCLAQLKSARGDVTTPEFDRQSDAVVPAGGIIPATARFVLVEGNYLLLTRPGWIELAPMFDLSIHLAVPEAVLRARLLARWADLPAEEARRRVEENDLPNGRLLARENRAADFRVMG